GAADRAGDGEPARADWRQPIALEPPAPLIERLEGRVQHGVTLNVAAGFEPDRRRARGETRGKRALTKVDADADGDDACRAAWSRAAGGRRQPPLEQNAGDLAPADADIVRPFEACAEIGQGGERVSQGERADERVTAPTFRRAPRPHEHRCQ